MAFTTARPTAPPTWRLVLSSPEATPASAGITPSRPAIVIGMKHSERPMPFSTNGPEQVDVVPAPGTGSRAMSTRETVRRRRPAVSTRRGPNRVTSACAPFETTAMVTATAANARPVSTAE